ncbi:hypothetical protein AAHC03_05732 [Spirometra sp. Aus1]
MTEEGGDAEQPMASMFIELCQLTDGVPWTLRGQQEPTSGPKRYWHERYRWVEMEEAFDTDVGEFSPPEVPNFTYEEINVFKSRVKKDLVFQLSHKHTIEAVFEHLPTISTATDTIQRTDTETYTDSGYFIPFFHPQVTNSGKSPIGMPHEESQISEISVNRDLTRCLAPKSKCCCILVGLTPEVERPILQFVRIETPISPQGIVEVDYPLEFIIISTTPHSEAAEGAVQIGRIFGTLLIDKAFRKACEHAVNSDEIYAACKEQLKHWVVQCEHTERKRRSSASEESDPFEGMESEEEPLDPSIIFDSASSKEKLKSWTSRCYHQLCPPLRDLALGLVDLVKRYPSDFKDAFSKGNASVAFGSILFVYFVIFSPAITFGTLMGQQVDPAYTVSNSILTSGITTLLHSLFAGQPIGIIGPSGPGFIMEKIIAKEAKEMNMNYFIFRAWVLIYAIIMGFVLLSLNLSGLAKHAKKSMEELFSAFISGFLIIKAMFSLFRFIPQTLPPLNTTLGHSGEAVWHKAAESGVDVFIALLMVCFSMTVVRFKGSHLIRRRVRFWVGAMNVPLGMIAMSAVNRIFFWAYEISRLRIPPANHLNYSSWFNVPNFSQMTNYGTASASYAQGRAAIFGLILGFLIFVEIALNGIVPLRGMSKKPSPIVVDHVLANIVYPILALFLGLPIMSGVPIRTIANMVALAKMEPHPAPGRPPKVLYLVETRVNTAIVGVLIIISVFLGNILQYIPVAALLGLFLFLGIFGMKGLRFRKLITATFSRRKYWCEWNVLDGMPRPQVIVFTGIWVAELMLLYTLLILGEYETLMMASTAIPFFLVFCAVLRNFILPRWKWMAPYLEKIDPPCVPDIKTKTA